MTAFTRTKNYVNRSTFTTRIASGARPLLKRLPVICHLLVNQRLNICAYDLNSWVHWERWAVKWLAWSAQNLSTVFTLTMRSNETCTLLEECSYIMWLLQVSEELIRVAILWHELWHEGLEEASRMYFSEGNVKGMFTVLEPLHQMMERGPQTLKETSFNQVRLTPLIVSKGHKLLLRIVVNNSFLIFSHLLVHFILCLSPKICWWTLAWRELITAGSFYNKKQVTSIAFQMQHARWK